MLQWRRARPVLSSFVLVSVFVLVIGACSSDKQPSAAPSSSSGTGGSAALGGTSTTAAPPCSHPHPAGLTAESFDFQGTNRTYELYVPKSYDGTREVPVVFEFHGFGSSAAAQVVYGDFRPLADRDDFVIVAPDGQDSPGGRHFNLTSEAGLQNDPQMVTSLLDTIESQLCVDTQRVFATGMSDGGAMTSALACIAPDRFAAFGAVAVVIYPESFMPACATARRVAIEAFSGTADPIVPFQGGKVNCCGGASLAAPSDTMANWANHDSCAPDSADNRLGTEVIERTWHGCQDGTDVTFYIVDGGGHTWPGSAIKVAGLGLTTDQVDASSTIWAFFQQHPLAPASH
ncbi:MAG TPA: PHB depolymerase family esterase [Acidimicrobiales bacterium]